MKTLTHRLLLFAAGTALAVLAGSCSTPEPKARSAEIVRDIDRNTAIATAFHDASVNFPDRPVSRVAAHRLGSVWVVDLVGEGGGMRYAISAHDGSIRQRSTFQ